MREALNGFVIRGVSSNIPFQAALLAHPKFVAGDFNTGFIAEHYAQGFRAEDVPHDDPDFLVALAGAAYRRYRERAAGISGQLAGHGVRIGSDFVVVVKGRGGQHRHVPVTHPGRRAGGTVTVDVGGTALRHQSRLALRRHPAGQLQRPAVHGPGRAPRPVVPRASTTACASRRW
jgi:propionyl-CoA carboxylase alpha chain